ncbi:MAG: dTDP-4-dehydrorhamnose reductase [Proteobacteria bacterium]|nr:dTDP-4-dehydrorhamnose reductase [Pseudomonadota bacterium]
MATKPLRILLTGKGGQVGNALLPLLGETVLAPDRSDFDLSQPESLRPVIREFRPDVIINPAAYTAVDKAEGNRGEAFAVNGVAPGVLGEEAQKLGAAVIHFSTDYVFDGRKDGAYVEEDAPNPVSVYGASKLAGERALSASGADCVILRTSWVVSAHGNNFVKTILRLSQERDTIAVVDDQHGAPTSADFLAQMVRMLVEALATDRRQFPFGLYHLVPGGSTTWHALAQHIVAKASRSSLPVRLQPDAVTRTTTAQYNAPAKRPLNSRMATDKFRRNFRSDLSPWQQGVDDVLDRLLGGSTVS